MGKVTYYGNPENPALRLAAVGDITTDRKGLSSGRVKWRVMPHAWADLPALGVQHPYADFLGMERRTISFAKGYWEVTGEFAGCEKEVMDPHYEFQPGVGTEPIETVKNFVSEIAGKPSAPLNGAIFVDENGDITKDNARGVFSRFTVTKADGTLNPWAGLESVLVANNTVWVKSWTQRGRPSGANQPLTVVDTVPGPEPAFASNFNWLAHPVGYTVRGRAFDCRQVFLLSGDRGWNNVVYSGGGA